MDFKDLIKQLGERVTTLKDSIQTEEATKNAFIMPFIQALGYDVFNPLEVVPEFTADIGLKKGEKVDYAIMKEGKPQILIECKWWGESLDAYNSQLFRYFHTTNAKFGLLTNGINYRFYTDLVETNKMDEKPFLDFNITDFKEVTINEIKKFHKSYFDVDNIVNSASELKYSNEIRNILIKEMNEPSADFVRFFVKQVYAGQAKEKIIVQFTGIVKKTFNQLVSDLISDRLKTALKQEQASEPKAETIKEQVAQKPDENKVDTTEEEMQAFYIIKAILRQKVDCDRIYYRDFQRFFSVLIDNSLKKTVCKLYLTDTKKAIGIVDDEKNEQKYELANLDDIFNYTDKLVMSVDKIVAGK